MDLLVNVFIGLLSALTIFHKTLSTHCPLHQCYPSGLDSWMHYGKCSIRTCDDYLGRCGGFCRNDSFPLHFWRSFLQKNIWYEHLEILQYKVHDRSVKQKIVIAKRESSGGSRIENLQPLSLVLLHLLYHIFCMHPHHNQSNAKTIKSQLPLSLLLVQLNLYLG